MRQFLLGLAGLSFLILAWMMTPTSVSAAGAAQGFITDPSGNGINGATVRAIVTREECPDEGECTTRVTTPTVTTSNHPQTKEPGFFQFRDPEEGSGMIDCRSEFRLEVRLPGSSAFVPYADAGSSTNVLGVVSTALAQGHPGNVPSNCRVVEGKVPGAVVGNVASEGSQNYRIVCDEQPKTPPPSGNACQGDCTLTDNNACQGAGGESCKCVDQGNGKGSCQVCPTGTTYNPTTKKCEPPAKVCNGDCNLTDTTACQGAGGESCKCVDQGGGKGSCQVCPTGTTYNPTTKKCEPPTEQACNASCTRDNNSACAAASSKVPGCNCIIPDDGNAGTCGVCPADKPYNPVTKKCEPPAACNVSCTTDTYCNAAKDGCTACLPNATGGKTCQKPFNENMCQCDGIDIGGKIVPGQKSTFVAYAKVMGTDQNLAQVQSLAFHVAQDNKVIYDSNPVSVEVVSKDATMTRYKATFSYTFPANINTKSIYRVYVDSPKCSQKTAMVIEPETTTSVLGTTACVDNRSDLDKWWSSVVGIFTGNNGDPCAAASLASSDQQSASSAPAASGDSNLQLKTFGDATVTDKSCRFVFFRFQQ